MQALFTGFDRTPKKLLPFRRLEADIQTIDDKNMYAANYCSRLSCYFKFVNILPFWMVLFILECEIALRLTHNNCAGLYRIWQMPKDAFGHITFGTELGDDFGASELRFQTVLT